MKKFIGIFLAVIIAAACITPAFASQECNCGNEPLVIITGMNSHPMVMDMGTENETVVFPPDIDVPSLIPPIVQGLGAALIAQDWSKITDYVLPLVWDILGPVGCDENGDSDPRISVVKYNTSMADYPFMEGDNGYNEFGLTQEAIDRYGADHVYFYNYDWRLDPLDHAKELNTLIKTAIEESGHSQVNLAACSMGGVQVMAYLAEFGSDDIESVAFLSSTFFGAQIASDLFTKRIVLDKGAVLSYLNRMLAGGEYGDFIVPLLSALDAAGILQAILNLADTAVEALVDIVFEDALIDIFATMPGLWALVQPEDYELAKQEMLGNRDYPGLVERIDYMHENVTLKRETLLKEAEANGTKIVVFSHYEIPAIPVYEGAPMQHDGMLDTAHTSGGATTAKYGGTLGSDYVQANTDCGHNHLSVDGAIDASTCIFPEYTWFFKGSNHVGTTYGYDLTDFIFTLLACDKQPTVNSDGLYSQFLEDVGKGKLRVLGGELVRPEEPTEPEEPETTLPETTTPEETTGTTEAVTDSEETTADSGSGEGGGENPDTGIIRYTIPFALLLVACVPLAYKMRLRKKEHSV